MQQRLETPLVNPCPKLLSQSIKTEIHNSHVKAWHAKPMHGYLSRKMCALNTDHSMSNAWTRSHKLTSHVEGYLCAIQEQEIATRYLTQKRLGKTEGVAVLCRHCKTHPEDIAHIVGSCPSLAPSMYLPLRHDQVAKTLYNAVCRKVDPTQPFKRPESVSQVGPLEIWWDQRINTSPKVENNKPDMVIWDKCKKDCTIVEIGIPLDSNVSRNESEEASKYVPLKIGLQRVYPNYSFTIVTIIIGATGYVTRNLINYIMKLGFDEE